VGGENTVLAAFHVHALVEDLARWRLMSKGGGSTGFGAFSSEVDTGSHSNQVYADCVDLSAVENASK
jgi:hypothetical protein